MMGSECKSLKAKPSKGSHFSQKCRGLRGRKQTKRREKSGKKLWKMKMRNPRKKGLEVIEEPLRT